MRRLAVAAAVVVMAACALVVLIMALPFLIVGHIVGLVRVRVYRPDPVDARGGERP